MNTIRNYRNHVTLRFTERGDCYSLKVPHYNKWRAIISFLRRRGFEIGENPTYKEQFSILSKYHKMGIKQAISFKSNVVCLMEIGQDMISVEFGNIQNLWVGSNQAFWDDPQDERFTKLTYLEQLHVKIEIKKLTEFCSKYNHTFIVEDSDLSPEEFIINKLRINPHIHGKVNCLNDIKLHIKEDSYNYKHNSNDANDKKIICGDTKYFYDYPNKRLSVGTVWHNINNMWWVIINDRKRNLASRDLFDFDTSLPRRKARDSRKTV